MKYLTRCPNCGRFTSVSINKKDIRNDMRLPCEHCHHNEPAKEWKKHGKKVTN